MCLVAGLVCAMALILVTAFTYPLSAARTPAYVVGVVGSLLGLAALGWWIGARALRISAPGAWRARSLSILWGAGFGLTWTIEISYNNVLAQPVAIRDPVDNIFWAAIALGMLVLAATSSFRERRIGAGLRAGFWSGLVSGLVACLTALLLVVLGMPLLLRDPANLAEWAMRGPTSGFASMSAYFAYQTLAGAMLHLVVLGMLMGALLGLLGGLVGLALVAGRSSAAGGMARGLGG